MELRAITELVSQNLVEPDLQVNGRLAGGDPTVQIVDFAHQPPRLLAIVTDHRTDRFSLRLEDFEFQDFAYQLGDQAVLVGSYCKIVSGFRRGEGTYGRTRPLLGFLGKVRQTYSIKIDGDLFTALTRELAT